MEIKCAQFFAYSRQNNTMNYLFSSNGKHEMDIVCFKVEVLAKYRSYPSKYILDEGFLRSKDDGWILQSLYFSNNMFYCYLYDLSLLPIEEQEYWKIFNVENPEVKESKFARNRDFYCKFENTQKDDLCLNLKNLKSIKMQVRDQAVALWEPIEEDLEEMINNIMLVHQEEYKHYRDEFLLPLCRLVIDGFNKKGLQDYAQELNIEKGHFYGSLILLEKILTVKCNESIAKQLVKPLRNLQNERSSRSAHGGKSVEKDMVQKAEKLLKEINQSIVDIVLFGISI